MEKVKEQKMQELPIKRRQKNLKTEPWQVRWAMRLRRRAIIRSLRIARQITVQ